MAFTQFIKDLLYTNDKLIIPGFGGFVAQYTPAQLNIDKNVVLPPGKHFIFDATLTVDDGVFAAYVSKKTLLSFPEASQAVKEMVTDFHKKLKEGDTIFIEDVGYFLLDDNKAIRFKRNDERNYNTDSFGLDPVPFKAVQNTYSTDETELPVKRRFSLAKILLIFLAVNIVGALTAIVYWKYDNIKAYIQHFSVARKDSVPAVDTANIFHPEDTTALGQYIDTTTNIKNALRYEETVKKDSVVATNDNNDESAKYYIIAGSFQSYKKAELHSALLKKRGFNPEIIEFSQQLFRVSVGEYKSKEEALNQLGLIKCRKGAENAWLLLK